MVSVLCRRMRDLIVPDILTRMILWELTTVFGTAFLSINGIVLAADAFVEATHQGLSLTQTLRIIPLLLPGMLPYTIPGTTLFATCVVYGRLAADNEILAVRSAGIHMAKLVWPALLLGMMASTTTMVLYYWLTPYAHSAMSTMITCDVEEWLYTALRRDLKMTDPKLNLLVWAHQVQDRKLIQALFKTRNPDGQGYDCIAMASEAELRVDLSRRRVLVHMHQGTVIFREESSYSFHDRVLEIPLPDSFQLKKPNRPFDLTWGELMSRGDQLDQEGTAAKKELTVATTLAKTRLADCRLELADFLAAGPLGSLHVVAMLPFKGAGVWMTSADVSTPVPLEGMTAYIDHLKSVCDFTRSERKAVEVEIQMRPVLAIGCLCFALIGCPVAIWFRRSDYLSAFVTCFLPIEFMYYPLVLLGMGLAREGFIHPALSIWFSDVFLGLSSIFLLYFLFRK